MGVFHVITIGTIALTSLIPASCAKMAGKTKSPVVASQAPAKSASSRTKDLGVLQLTNHFETCVELGDGKSCTFKPELLDRRNLQITLVVESKSPNGKTQGLNVMKVVTRRDQPFEVDVGGTDLTLTPQLAAE